MALLEIRSASHPSRLVDDDLDRSIASIAVRFRLVFVLAAILFGEVIIDQVKDQLVAAVVLDSR